MEPGARRKPPVASGEGTSGFGTMLQTANMFLPISELFAFVRVIIGLAAGLAMVWAIYKVIDWLPIT